jgi:hypothetical protein
MRQPVTGLLRQGDTLAVLTEGRLRTTRLGTDAWAESELSARGLVTDSGRVLAWGDHGVHEVRGSLLRQVSTQAVSAAYREEDGSLAFTSQETLRLSGGQVMRTRAPEPTQELPFSVSLGKHRVVAALGSSLYTAIPWGAVSQTNLEEI